VPAEPAPRHMVLVVVGWAIVGLALYYLIRLAVLFVFALPFLVIPPTPLTAGFWLLVAEPVALGIGAYLTVRTKTGTRLFRTVLNLVVFASALIGHVTWALGNPYILRGRDGALIAAWVAQAACIAIGAAFATRRQLREAETPAEEPAEGSATEPASEPEPATPGD
jgi:hypothetical protein